MTGDTALRWVRVLTLASLLFTSGLAGHVVAGGHTPTTPVLIPLYVLTVVVVTQFAGAPISPARVVVLLVGGQGLLHASLELLDGATPTGINPMSGAATDVAGMAATSSSHHMTHFGGGASHDWAASPMDGAHIVMLLAHVTAGLVVGMWLAAGERALWTLLAFTVRPVVDAWRSLTAIASRVCRSVGMGLLRPQADWLPRYSIRSSKWAATVVSRRGPPCAASPESCADAAVSTV